MTHEKITVDEPLISTDVDSLIRTLSDKKRISLNDLRQISKIDRKTMEKWLAVLEDEGYIHVEYGIRGTFVNWIGLGINGDNGDYSIAEPTQFTKQVSEPPPQKVEQVQPLPIMDAPVQEEVSEPEEVPQEINSTSDEIVNDVYEEQIDEPEPEEMLSEYLARKKEKGSIDVGNLRATILTKLDKSDEPIKEEEPRVEVVEEIEQSDEDDEQPEGEVIHPVSRFVRDQTGVRELMNAYVSEINKEKVEIEALKKEKEDLYRDKFTVIEGKMHADIAVLSEKVIEKQSRIAELKERVLELPDKVDDLNRLQGEMDKLKREGRSALERTRKKADEFVANMNDSKSSLEEKIKEVDTTVLHQSDKVTEFENIVGSLDSRAEKIRSVLENARIQIDSLSNTMNSLTTDLQQVEQMKGEVGTIAEVIKANVADRGDELKALEAELEGISRMEHWVQEYIRDYEHKVDEIEDYVSKSEDELAELKSAADSVYMREYLSQLEVMTEDYQTSLYNAVSREQDLDNKIADSKARITDLVKESQEMIKKLKSEAPSANEFNRILARVKERSSQVKRVVTEKQSERNNLSEESRTTRKTPSKMTPKTSKAAKKKKK
ncbi:MAG: hypothetical protein ABID61_01055 [Candidatus Micrarchaeota archaeon]